MPADRSCSVHSCYGAALTDPAAAADTEAAGIKVDPSRKRIDRAVTPIFTSSQAKNDQNPRFRLETRLEQIRETLANRFVSETDFRGEEDLHPPEQALLAVERLRSSAWREADVMSEHGERRFDVK